MKKLALFLALCLMIQAIGLTAFAEEQAVEIPEPAQSEAAVTEEAPAEEEPAKEEPVKEEPVKEEPAQEEPVQEEPAQEEPAQEEPAQEEPAQEEPAQEEPAQEEPAQEEPAQEEPAQEEPAQEEPAQEEPAQEEPAQEEPAQEEPAQEEPAQEEPAEEEEPEEEEVLHFTDGYILLKAGTRVCASLKITNIQGTITADSYAYAKIEQQSETDPAKDWLAVVFDTEEGEQIKAFIQVKNVTILTDEEQDALKAKLAQQNVRELGGKPVPVAAYKASETAEEAADEPTPAPVMKKEAEMIPAAKGGIEDNGDASNFVLDNNDCICEYTGSMTALVLPTKVSGKTVKGITQTAFSGNTVIQSIAIPETGYTEIENGAFRNCTALESVSMANAVTTIVAEAFAGCTNLKAISWPAGLKTIEHDAFNGCTSLRAIGMTTNLEEIGDNAFKNCSSIVDFDMEAASSLKTIGSSAFSGCTGLKAIVLPNNVETIKNSAFENCSAATKLTLPSKLERIESFTFKNCSALQNVQIKDKVTFIGQEAFYNCSGLDYVVIPTAIKNILKNAFSGISANTVLFMNSITTVQISENGLGTKGIVLGKPNKDPHKYVKAHSGMKFVTSGQYAYILRCYEHFLGRTPSLAEKANYIRKLANGNLNGVTIVKAFLDSPECKNKKWSNEDIIKKLYRVMLARTSDPSASEVKSWKEQLDVGMTMDSVMAGISGSKEYKDKCKNWSLTPGSIKLTNYRDQKKAYTIFVRNAYKWAYYDGTDSKVTTKNLEDGCKLLIKDKYTAYKFLHSLVDSKTFKDKKYNNTTFVTRMYQIYLQRTPKTSEVESWVKKITVDKKTKAWVEQGFAGSAEFKNKMTAIGLKAK